MSNFGKFSGEVAARWLTHGGDDRDMELLEKFTYIDQDGKRWEAPKGSVVNGASIPASLWATVGPPFVGDYRRASVIHDVACEQMIEPHADVHLAFYYAMRADGVGWLKANTMYQAVKRFGPTWDVNTGSLSSTQSVDEGEMERFVAAALAAADEIGEDGDLDEVEARIDEILAGDAPRAKSKNAKTKKARGTRTKSKRSSPKLKRISRRETSGPDQVHESPHIFVEGHDATREQLAETVELRVFRSERVELSKADRLRLVEQGLLLMEHNYVHLPLKEAMHAVDPVQRLRLLQRKLLRTPEDELEYAHDFHRELASIFLSVRDLHTNYFLPNPIGSMTAFVPFLVEAFYGEERERRFLVTRLLAGFDEPPFGPGVEILRWNGTPIERAVELNGDRFAGSNPDARRARGIETLTVRSLVQTLPPDEDFVLLEYRSDDGEEHELRVPWFIFSPDTMTAGLADMPPDVAVAQGVDVEQQLVRLAKKVLFAPDVVAEEAKLARRRAPRADQGLESMMPGVLEARPVESGSRELGYVRIRTFSVTNARRFVSEFVRLVEQLPQDGLIIDVRGNGGGLIPAGEQLLQVLSPRRIAPTLFQLRNTPLNLQLAERTAFLSPWRTSMRQALVTGATYSAGFPITDPALANNIGQRYHGPVVLITDALCYSTTDIFAAGFQDHDIGLILGVDGNTGAGGANVWGHDLLQHLLPDEERPYHELPGNAGMRVSMRRTIRVGTSMGTVLEDLGVVPDKIHHMTRSDLMHSNRDLIAAAAALIAEMRLFRMQVTPGSETDDGREVTVNCVGIDQLDVYVNRRPFGSAEVQNGANTYIIPAPPRATVEFEGYSDGTLVAARRISL